MQFIIVTMAIKKINNWLSKLIEVHIEPFNQTTFLYGSLTKQDCKTKHERHVANKKCPIKSKIIVLYKFKITEKLTIEEWIHVIETCKSYFVNELIQFENCFNQHLSLEEDEEPPLYNEWYRFYIIKL